MTRTRARLSMTRTRALYALALANMAALQPSPLLLVLCVLGGSLWQVGARARAVSTSGALQAALPVRCSWRPPLARLGLRGGADEAAGDGEQGKEAGGDKPMQDADAVVSRSGGGGGGERPANTREGHGAPCLDWRNYRPNTEAEQRREARLAELFDSKLLNEGDLDVACVNRLRESSIAVAETSLRSFKELLESDQVKGNPSAYLMRMLRNRAMARSLPGGRGRGGWRGGPGRSRSGGMYGRGGYRSSYYGREREDWAGVAKGPRREYHDRRGDFGGAGRRDNYGGRGGGYERGYDSTGAYSSAQQPLDRPLADSMGFGDRRPFPGDGDRWGGGGPIDESRGRGGGAQGWGPPPGRPGYDWGRDPDPRGRGVDYYDRDGRGGGGGDRMPGRHFGHGTSGVEQGGWGGGGSGAMGGRGRWHGGPPGDGGGGGGGGGGGVDVPMGGFGDYHR